eukprot:TRINITY_DN69560_c0_g1_i1.p1 TRINITY_DN69560_c0_g1~~TRINITY_DN69560_c0_g1_i1.p1  ORF type:complete len:432 (-),score=-5.34 TRINITY_DN69560_c0_g1_i1:57-1244(-)
MVAYRQAAQQVSLSRLHRGSYRFASDTARNEGMIKLDKKYARWLYTCAGMCFIIVTVGGLTRLTESGLSITEWKPVTGVVWPMSQSAWETEFNKYKVTPEYEQRPIEMRDFKFIYFLEWFHRLFGRTIGMAYLLPLVYFYMTPSRAVTPLPRALLWSPFIPLALGLASQGLIGWLMVSTGLKHANFEDGGKVRVSQYSLATHLMAAVALYSGFLWNGQAFSNPGVIKPLVDFQQAKPMFRTLMRCSMVSAFLTMFMGGITAGLDAGLVYPQWPSMGGHFMPPECFPDKLSPLRHDVTAQWTHRMMAYLTTGFIVGTDLVLWKNKTIVPKQAWRIMAPIRVMLGIQLLLGISTVLSCVQTPIAASHQMGAMALWTTLLHAWFAMRMKPYRRLVAKI